MQYSVGENCGVTAAPNPRYGTGGRSGSAGPEADGNGIGGSPVQQASVVSDRQAHPGSRSLVSGGAVVVADGGGGRRSRQGSRRVEIRIWSCPLVAAPVRPPARPTAMRIRLDRCPRPRVV